MIFNYGPHNSTSSGIDFNFGGSFDPKNNILFSYSTYTNQSFAQAEAAGICSIIYDSNDNKKWDLKILQDCTIKFLKKILIKNILLVGGGRDGEDGTYDANEGGQGYSNCYYTGGKGGDGGDILLLTEEKTFEKNLNITCIIGNNQENTRNTSLQYSNQNFQTQLNNEKTYGKGEKGGIYQNGNYYAPAPISENYSKDGYFFHSEYYGAGGGGGGLQQFGVRNSVEKQGGKGGQTGGGNGEGYNNSNSASSGTNGYGAGGGGGIGSAYHYNHGIGSGAAGGSGVIIISNY